MRIPQRRLLDENKMTNAKAKIMDLLLMLDVGPQSTLERLTHPNTQALYWKECSTRIKSSNPKQDPPKERNLFQLLSSSYSKAFWLGWVALGGGWLGAMRQLQK